MFVYQCGGYVQVLCIVYVVFCDGEFEWIEMFDGKLCKLLWYNDELYMFVFECKLCVVECCQMCDLFFVLFGVSGEYVMFVYDVKLFGKDCVVGIDVQVVEFVLKDVYCFMYKLWVDVCIGLLLCLQMFDVSDCVFEQIVFL